MAGNVRAGRATATPGGAIVLAATPVGNAADASPRLAELLATADVIAAEDTRRLRRLLATLKITPVGQVLSYYDANERDRSAELVEQAAHGARVAVVSDAGMPTISDPGYRVVALAAERGVTVTAVPGPSAVLMALAVSGLPVDRFCFEGFLPRRQGERATRIAELVREPRTMVFFEAPHRVATALQALADGFGGQRRAAVCREMTKTYEEVRRGTLAELVAWARDGVLGECTVVVAGASPQERRMAQGLTGPEQWATAVRDRQTAGLDRRAAIAAVAQEAGVSRRLVYQAVVEDKSSRPQPKGDSGPRP